MSNYTKTTNFASKDNLSPGNPLKIVKGTEIDTEFNNIATAVATKTDNASANITGGSITGITDLAIADGGTGASTANAALNNLLPSQASASGKYLKSNGTDSSWDALDISTADITGTLPVANGGTGVTSSTGTGSVVLSNSPTLVTPALGTPASGVATNLTGLPLSTGVTGTLPIANGGTGQTTANAAFNALAPSQATASGKYLKSDGTNTSWDALDISTADITGTLPVANGGTGVTTSTGTGSVVLSNSPTLVTPALGTPSSATLTNATGLPISTGVLGLGTGVATALAVNVGSAGAPLVNGGVLGTPSSGTATNLTGLPISTGVSGLGTGVATALAVNVGSAGAPVVNGGALGTPSSGTATNLTGLPLSTGVTGTLPVANGGTGQTTYTDGQLLIGNSTGNTLAKATLTAGSGISITNGSGSITIAASGGGGSGDVVGPASSTDNAFTRFDGTTGKLIQNSTGATLSDTGGATFTGSVDIAGTSTAGSNIKLYEDTDNGTNYVAFKAPDTIASNVTWTLPSTDGTSSQVLSTNGSGTLSWATASATATGVSDTSNSSTGYFQIPQGTTAQRPATPANGMTRINTTTNAYEIYSSLSGAWVSVYQFSAMPSITYLVVAGGGSGGLQTNRGSAGAGAGGYRSSVSGESSGGGASAESPLTVSLATNYTVTVGAGGASISSAQNGNVGSNSVFASITSTGGGAGGGYSDAGGGSKNGGSGGGAGGYSGSSAIPGTGTANQGYGGGYGVDSYGPDPTGLGGGGGGAGAVGGSASGTTTGSGGSGGVGVASSITGSSVYRAGGGGGSVLNNGSGGQTVGAGGNGGGGAGGSVSSVNGVAGTANTGGGGGGGYINGGGVSGAGGSGIVILKYLDTFTITLGAGLTGSTTTSGGYKVTTITAGTGNVQWN